MGFEFLVIVRFGGAQTGCWRGTSHAVMVGFARGALPEMDLTCESL